jgi:hypothetical protein
MTARVADRPGLLGLSQEGGDPVRQGLDRPGERRGRRRSREGAR